MLESIRADDAAAVEQQLATTKRKPQSSNVNLSNTDASNPEAHPAVLAGAGTLPGA